MRVDRRALHGVLRELVRVTDPKASLPILSHVLLQATAGVLTVTAACLERTLSCHLPAEGDIQTCLPAKMLTVLMAPEGKGDAGDVVINDTSDGTCSISLEGHTSKIAAMSPDDFPEQPDRAWSLVAMGQTAAFAEALAFVLPAVSHDEGRPHLNGIQFESDRLIATDGHRLHLTPSPVPVAEPLLISLSAAQTIKRILLYRDNNKFQAHCLIVFATLDTRIGALKQLGTVLNDLFDGRQELLVEVTEHSCPLPSRGQQCSGLRLQLIASLGAFGLVGDQLHISSGDQPFEHDLFCCFADTQSLDGSANHDVDQRHSGHHLDHHTAGLGDPLVSLLGEHRATGQFADEFELAQEILFNPQGVALLSGDQVEGVVDIREATDRFGHLLALVPGEGQLPFSRDVLAPNRLELILDEGGRTLWAWLENLGNLFHPLDLFLGLLDGLVSSADHRDQGEAGALDHLVLNVEQVRRVAGTEILGVASQRRSLVGGLLDDLDGQVRQRFVDETVPAFCVTVLDVLLKGVLRDRLGGDQAGLGGGRSRLRTA